jgi:acetylornithine deacetylase/succinyl-diaminopimelate desuccinylase-like protein
MQWAYTSTTPDQGHDLSMTRKGDLTVPTVEQFIDARFPEYLAELQTWTRQPSIAAEDRGVEEMAALVSERLERAGGIARVYDIPGGYPVVYGEFHGSGERALLSYNHYDVQPTGERAEWRFDPFGAEIEDGKLYGRGVADDKGCLLSRIQAVEAILATEGELPVTVKFLVEGEEEVGSPNLKPFVHAHQALLAADACIWEYAAKDALGRPSAALGSKGMCYVELVSRASRVDMHSMYASIIPNAAWRLVWALSTLKDGREQVLIDGFLDDVQPLSPAEIAVLEKVPLDEEGYAREAGLEGLLMGVKGMEAQERLYGLPTCTICGLESGHTGEGARTVLPAEARAKVDFRLVVDQDPDDIVRKLRAHLDRHGFEDIEIKPLAAFLPVKTQVTDPFVQIVIDAAGGVYDQPIVVQPTSPGSGPRSVFAGWTDMPIVGLGVANVGSQVHAPNENIAVEDYRQGIKHIAAIVRGMGAGA